MRGGGGFLPFCHPCPAEQKRKRGPDANRISSAGEKVQPFGIINARTIIYLSEAVGRALVLRRVDPLHSGLHDVKRVVTQRAEAAGGHAAEEVLEVGQRPRPVVADEPLVLVEPHEPQPLTENKKKRTPCGSFFFGSRLSPT